MKKQTNKKKSTQVSTIEEELKKQVFTTEEEIRKYELIRIEIEKELSEIDILSNPLEKMKRTLAIYKKYDSYTINERKREYRRAYNFRGSTKNLPTEKELEEFFSFIPENKITVKELKLELKNKGLTTNQIRWKMNWAIYKGIIKLVDSDRGPRSLVNMHVNVVNKFNQCVLLNKLLYLKSTTI